MNKINKLIKDYGLPYLKIIIIINLIGSVLLSFYLIINLFILNRPLIINDSESNSLLLKIISVVFCLSVSLICGAYLFLFEKKIVSLFERKN